MKKRLSSQLKHPVEFYSVEIIDNGIDGEKEVEIFFCAVRASLWPQSSKEVVENLRNEAPNIMKVRIAYRPGIYASMRMKHNNIMYELVSNPINPDMKNRMLDIIVKEI